MANISIRSVAKKCLDKTGTLRIRRDLYGYIFRGPMNRTLSLKTHVKLIRGDSINLSMILVRHDPNFLIGVFTRDDVLKMQAAIDWMRELYAQVGLGVRKIYWQYIDQQDGLGYTSVDSSKATDLTEEFSGNNDGIDVFYVSNVSDAGGWSNSKGPCDKDAWCVRTGAVLELSGSTKFSGILLAHEVGHYLKLKHRKNVSDITNVMGHDHDGNGVGSIDLTSVNLTTAQGNKMKKSCWVRKPCK